MSRKKNRNNKNKVLVTLSGCWIEMEFLLFTEMGAVMAILLSFLLFLKTYFPNTDFSRIVSEIAKNPEMLAAAAVFFIIGFIIITPLYYGIKWCYFQAAKGNSAPVSGAFFLYFEVRRWLGALALNTLTALRKLIIYIPFGIISVVGFHISSELCRISKNPVTEIFVRLGCVVLLFGAYLIYLLLTVKYEAVPFVFVEEPDGNTFDIFRKGIRYIDSSKGRYYSMIISYAPFMCLCIMGFPAVILLPVFSMAKACTCAEIIEDTLASSDKDKGADEKRSRAEAAVT